MFAVMRWITDGNRLSVHDLKYVSEPKLPHDQYVPGMCGLSVFVGFEGLWKFRILKVGGKLIFLKHNVINPLTLSDAICRPMQNV